MTKHTSKKRSISKSFMKSFSKNSSKSPSKLKHLISDYLDYIKDTTDVCKINRSVNVKLADIMMGDNINDKIKLLKLKSSINNTIGNDVPKQKLVEHCGDKSDKMLEKIGNSISNSGNAFGRKRKHKKSKKRSNKK
jgi:hypothetical protein